MALSQPSIEILMDLIEIKLGAMAAYDVESSRACRLLKRCRAELAAMRRHPNVLGGEVQALPPPPHTESSAGQFQAL